MAQLYGNGLSDGRDNNNRAPAGSWSKPKPQDNEPRNPIELRGLTYIAFCKVWAPLWVDEEEEPDVG